MPVYFNNYSLVNLVVPEKIALGCLDYYSYLLPTHHQRNVCFNIDKSDICTVKTIN